MLNKAGGGVLAPLSVLTYFAPPAQAAAALPDRPF
jgi:hypothetical protein